jgi:hypothetical protein
MACTSLSALPLTCGSEGTMGGISPELYVIAYNDLVMPEGGTVGQVYTRATNQMINAIGLAASKTFVKVGVLKNTAGLNESFVGDQTKALYYFNQTFTLVLGGLTIENRAFLKSVMNQPIAFIIKARSGNFYAAGLNGLFQLSAAEGGTGVAEADLNGYTLTFTGIDTAPLSLVDPLIIPDIVVS